MTELKKQNRPWFVMAVGLPCSGKTSWLSKEFMPYLADTETYAEALSTDDIIYFVATAKRKLYHQVFKDVIDYAKDIVDARIALSSYMGMNIILDMTNITGNSRMNKLKLLKNDDYYKVALVFNEPVKILKERALARANTGKLTTDRVIDDMAAKFEPVVKQEGFDDVITVKDFKLRYMPKMEKKDEKNT